MNKGNEGTLSLTEESRDEEEESGWEKGP